MAIFAAVSLLTGYNGLGLGLRKVVPSLRTIVYVEREAFAVANLVAKIKKGLLDDAPIWSDITIFDGKPFAGLVDILHAGIPCQPWSVAGKQKGITDERWIWRDIFRVIVEVMPKYIFLEEVPGFVRGGGLGYVLSDLAQAGYDAEWGCYTAAEVGAPHRRERLFILAHAGHNARCAKQEQQQKERAKELCGGNKLGDTTPANSTRKQQFGNDISLSSSKKMADTEHPESRSGIIKETPFGSGRGRFAIGNADMADSNGPGCEEQCRGESVRQEYQAVECSGTKWPARPGQPQYEWEEPRVVGDTRHIREGRAGRSRQVNTERFESELKQAQSGLGVSIARVACGMGKPGSRVDELRLLGNGVVPQQAEKAFRDLMAFFEANR